MKTFLTILLSLLLSITKAQDRKRFVIDVETKKPVAFTTVKVLNKPIGAIATENGEFNLVIAASDSVQFSSVGYKSKILAGKDIADSIFLKSQTKILKEVTVQAKSLLRTLILGFDTSRTDDKMNWGPGGKAEFAQQIDLPDSNKIYHVRKVFIRIKEHGCYGPLLLHIYSTDTSSGAPGEELFTKPVYFSKSNVKKSKAIIDISKEDIYISNNKSFYIGFSWLPNAEEQQCLTTIYFMPLMNSNTFSRTVMSNDYNWFHFYWGKDHNGKPSKATTLLSVEVDELN